MGWGIKDSGVGSLGRAMEDCFSGKIMLAAARTPQEAGVV